MTFSLLELGRVKEEVRPSLGVTKGVLLFLITRNPQESVPRPGYVHVRTTALLC
jgi:hypothetical protein